MPKRFSILFLLFALPLFAAVETPPAPADLNAPPADVQKFESGLVTKQLAAGKGSEHPSSEDIVRVRYTVWKSDGSLLQHVPAGKYVVIPVSKMVPGWGEAAKNMVVGEQSRAWVPPALNGGKTPLALLFDTELLEIIHYPTTPADVAAPPADAEKRPSGLAYKVLKAGSGTRHPSRRDTVVVHYSGWTTDGNMFDSSVIRGTPSEFKLDGVIRGWIEGLQLMSPGEKTRFWIPAKLAYASDKTKPQGMLVFDIELVEIK